jgi:predicted NBD/HSP70 family sugar kinase
VPAGDTKVARGTNLEHTREFNRRAVLDALRRSGTASRTEIAARTGLSLSAISSLVDTLVKDGWVAAQGRRSTARGQPPIDFALARDGAFGIGVSLDRDHAAAMLVGLTGDVVAERHRPLDDPSASEAVDVVAALTTELLGVLSRSERKRVSGLGIGVPGVMAKDGRVIRMVRLPRWEGFDLVEASERATGLPTTVTNDAIAAAVGESSYGHHVRGAETFFYVLFALGLGSSLVMHGHPHRGLWGVTGRLGHIPVDSAGPGCPACGGRGCLSLYASVEALAERLAAAGAVARGPLTASLDTIASRFGEGDAIIDAWIDEAAQALARGLVVLENLLDPDAYVFDGRMPRDVLSALVLRTEERYLAQRRSGARERRLRLLTGERGTGAVAFGAASVPLYVATAADLALVR